MSKCDKSLIKEKMFQSSVQIDFKRHNELPVLSVNGHRVTDQVWLLTDDHIVNKKRMLPQIIQALLLSSSSDTSITISSYLLCSPQSIRLRKKKKNHQRNKSTSSTSIFTADIPYSSLPNLADHFRLWVEWNTSDLPKSKQQNTSFWVKQVTQIKHPYTHIHLQSPHWQTFMGLQPWWLCLEHGEYAHLNLLAWKPSQQYPIM